MCMGSAQAQPLFPTPCIDAVVTLSDQHPSVPFDRPRRRLYVLRNAYDAFLQPFQVLHMYIYIYSVHIYIYIYIYIKTNKYWETQTHIYIYKYIHIWRDTYTLQPLCKPLHRSPSSATATRRWQVRGGHPITRTGHCPPPPNPQPHRPTYWGLGGIRKRRVASFSSPLFSSSVLLFFFFFFCFFAFFYPLSIVSRSSFIFYPLLSFTHLLLTFLCLWIFRVLYSPSVLSFFASPSYLLIVLCFSSRFSLCRCLVHSPSSLRPVLPLSFPLSLSLSLTLASQGYDRRPRNNRNLAWPLFWNSIGGHGRSFCPVMKAWPRGKKGQDSSSGWRRWYGMPLLRRDTLWEPPDGLFNRILANLYFSLSVCTIFKRKPKKKNSRGWPYYQRGYLILFIRNSKDRIMTKIILKDRWMVPCNSNVKTQFAIITIMIIIIRDVTTIL